MLVLLLVGCHGPDVDPPPVAGPPPTFDEAAARAGFRVQEGSFALIDPEDCCGDDGLNCLYNNPSTPYGSYVLPPAPDQTGGDPPVNGAGATFFLRADEAAVFLGRSPPRARYFAWRSYLTSRGGAPLFPVIGSLGPSLDNLVVAEQVGGDPFDQPLAVVTTADAEVEADVVQALLDSGWSREHVHLDRIPAGDEALALRMGVDAQADVFQVAVRIAVYEDPEAGAAYEAAPGRVLRLSPETPREAAALHPADPVPIPGSGRSEAPMRPAVDALQSAILQAYPDRTAYLEESNAHEWVTYDCILAGESCYGEIDDRYYARVPNFYLPTDEVFAVAFGVNHERSGHASYANFAVDRVKNLLGVASVDSSAFPGSARPWLEAAGSLQTWAEDFPETDPDDLYAWIVARDCDLPMHGGRPCLEVPRGCPGVETFEQMLISFRAYLDPATSTRPLASELVPDRVVAFTPTPTTTTTPTTTGP